MTRSRRQAEARAQEDPEDARNESSSELGTEEEQAMASAEGAPAQLVTLVAYVTPAAARAVRPPRVRAALKNLRAVSLQVQRDGDESSARMLPVLAELINAWGMELMASSKANNSVLAEDLRVGQQGQKEASKVLEKAVDLPGAAAAQKSDTTDRQQYKDLLGLALKDWAAVDAMLLDPELCARCELYVSRFVVGLNYAQEFARLFSNAHD